MLDKSGVESLLIVHTGEDSPVDAGDGEGDIDSAGRLCIPGDGGDERFDEGGVIKPASSVISARRSPVERLKEIGRVSGDESWLLPGPTAGDLEPAATGVDSPSVDADVTLESTFCITAENESQPPVSPDQLDRLSCTISLIGGESVAFWPPTTLIGSWETCEGPCEVARTSGGCPKFGTSRDC